MKDTSTTTVSHEVTKKAYDSWKKEYDRCHAIFKEAESKADNDTMNSKLNYTKHKSLSDWIRGECVGFYGNLRFKELLLKHSKYGPYTQDVVDILMYKGVSSYHTNLRLLLLSGNDIQASVSAMSFIDKWNDF